jgi:hypothetical protein
MYSALRHLSAGVVRRTQEEDMSWMFGWIGPFVKLSHHDYLVTTRPINVI